MLESSKTGSTSPIRIPFVAKRPDGDKPWKVFGATEVEYQFWMPHICGIACTRSLILAKQTSAPSLWELTVRAKALGVFRLSPDLAVHGAFHVPLVALLRENGIDASVFGRLLPEQIWNLSGNGAMMLSVNLAMASDHLAGSHLVLIVGRDGDHVLVHDSAHVLDKDGNGCKISRTRLGEVSNGRGILVPWTSLRPMPAYYR